MTRRFQSGQYGSQYKAPTISSPPTPTVTERRDEARKERGQRRETPPEDVNVVEEIASGFGAAWRALQTAETEAIRGFSALPASVASGFRFSPAQISRNTQSGQRYQALADYFRNRPATTTTLGGSPTQLRANPYGSTARVNATQEARDAVSERERFFSTLESSLGAGRAPQTAVEAARLTGLAVFGDILGGGAYAPDEGVNVFPRQVSPEVVNELPYNPQSQRMRQAFSDAFGVEGFESQSGFMESLGYRFDPEARGGLGAWIRWDPVDPGYGGGSYIGGYGGGRGYRSGGGRGYESEWGLHHWRI